MKAKGNRKTKVNVITLGCSKNLVDSEVLLSQLAGNGIEAEQESARDEAGVVIINTCGFIEKAKQESIDTILRFADAKKQGVIEKLYVTGCLSGRYKKELALEIPEVDEYFGTHDLPSLLRKFNADYRHELVGERKLSGPGHYAYMKISEGCDRPCSFCAIPLMRGKHVSRPVEELVREARYLAKSGIRELILIAQDTTYYGLDLYKKRQLARLLRELAAIEGIEWIRLHYAYPSGFPADVIEVMADQPKICQYLDIPLQHGSNRMLELMRRGITAEKTERLIREIRERIPDIAIRTTMIVGHPGEREPDFEFLLDFTRKMQFDRLGVFTYSHEEGTHSFNMADDVPEEVKEERANRLMAVQEEISLRKNKAKTGKIFKVLIDRKEGGYYYGRTEFDSPEVDNEVMIDAVKYDLRMGDFARILITEALPYDLTGIPAGGLNQ
ncbi:MAG TPA: 30S ribosomal protein S12 methylthiotransferase RimO [Cyclobacteriaceae bacterium]|nr:30S ribosomal protein S12 methylthiotransferase RimO [Cyclobacteriaceae bacterium]